jgi:glycosyltransferase involved in cell wall biosynthesis
MRLLIINFEMDPSSAVLAWQFSVALQLADYCEKVVVLTNRAVNYSWPANMSVYVFPKILFRAPLRWLGGKWWVNLLVWWLCKKHAIETCFIHMNMEWGYRLWPVFRLLRIPVLLWYAHGTVTDELRRAHQHVTRVITSTPEGFRIASDKVKVIGQGIDTTLFTVQEQAHNPTSIITVGRVSSRKRIDLMVDVISALRELEPELPSEFVVIGGPLTDDDRVYVQQTMDKAARLHLDECIRWVGFLPVNDIPDYYRTAFLHLNLSLTGSMDKTVMEALAAGCPVLTSNEAFRTLLKHHSDFLVQDENPKAIAQQILRIYRQYSDIDRCALRHLVVGKHDRATYVKRITDELRELQDG